MSRERDIEHVDAVPDTDMSQRLRALDQFTGSLVARPRPAGAITTGILSLHRPPVSLVPVPRRARVFLRTGEGHGVFADLTLTAPRT